MEVRVVSLLLGAAVKAATSADTNSHAASVIATVIACGLIAFLSWSLICDSDRLPPVDDDTNPDHEQWI
jgi:hypothetical protein